MKVTENKPNTFLKAVAWLTGLLGINSSGEEEYANSPETNLQTAFSGEIVNDYNFENFNYDRSHSTEEGDYNHIFHGISDNYYMRFQNIFVSNEIDSQDIDSTEDKKRKSKKGKDGEWYIGAVSKVIMSKLFPNSAE